MDVDIFDVSVARYSPFQLIGVTHLTLTFCGCRFWDLIGNAQKRIEIAFNYVWLQGDLHIGFDTRDAAFKIDAKGFHVSLTERASREVAVMRRTNLVVHCSL